MEKTGHGKQSSDMCANEQHGMVRQSDGFVITQSELKRGLQ